MPVSYAQLKAMLDVDEPDYPALAEMAAGAMQHLRKLAASPDLSVASKAVSLAGIMGDTDSIGIVRSASKSRHALVRVAAAGAASLLPDSPQAARLVSALLDDADIGVVKIAARAATRQTDPAVKVKAKRANVRVHATARAATKETSQLKRAAAMARKAGKKAGGASARTKAPRKGGAKASAGQMPVGAMAEAPKGAKARTMPSGKMK
ncbi:MAG: hypothetical protein ABWX70_09695 [Hyphomicrobium sp.]